MTIQICLCKVIGSEFCWVSGSGSGLRSGSRCKNGPEKKEKMLKFRVWRGLCRVGGFFSSLGTFYGTKGMHWFVYKISQIFFQSSINFKFFLTKSWGWIRIRTETMKPMRIHNILLYIFLIGIYFWRARVFWPLLCLRRPFCIFERCLDSNPESCRSKQARYLPT
jgi:hypothetical protein